MRHKALRHFLIVSVIFLTGCSTIDSIKEKVFGDDSAEKAEVKAPDEPTDKELYTKAVDLLKDKKYKESIENFQEIERLYPFSKLAIKARVMVAYTHYKNEEYETSIDVIDRFISLNPGNKDIAYMYYLKALSYYDRVADVKRDQKITEKALAALDELYKRYPDTEYAKDAKIKIDLVNDHLAGKEMEIGRFYLRGKKYIAAINRFRKVVNKFQTTTHVQEALYRLTEAYLLLGITEEAVKNAAVLGHNYPNSKWYKYAYRIVENEEDSPVPVEDNRSWFTFGGDDAKLPKENKADSWFKKLF